MTAVDEDVFQYQIFALVGGWSVNGSTGSLLLRNPDNDLQFNCNATAFAALRLIDGKKTSGEIAALLAVEFDQTPAVILADLAEMVPALISLGAIRPRAQPALAQRRDLLNAFQPEPPAADPHPCDFFRAIFCINRLHDEARWAAVQRRFEALGIADRVVRFPAVETPSSHHIGCTLSHRLLVGLAARHQLDNFLVFEDDALLLDRMLDYLPLALQELQTTDWKLFYLGASLHRRRVPALPRFSYLRSSRGLTCTHAVAYSSRCYEQVLSEIPDDIATLMPWMRKYAAIDQYLASQVSDGFLATPTLSAQPPTLIGEDAEWRHRYR